MWGPDGEVLPAHDARLTELELSQAGLRALLKDDADNPTAGATQLDKVKALLLEHAGMQGQAGQLLQQRQGLQQQ